MEDLALILDNQLKPFLVILIIHKLDIEVILTSQL